MGRRIHSNKGIRFTALLLILVFALAGCGNRRQTGEPGKTPQAGEAENDSQTGKLIYGYFFEKEGIALSAGERFMYSDWDTLEFDYICMDPTCNHLTGSCSARALSGEGELGKDFCVVYQNRLVILHAYYELETEYRDSETDITNWNYYTDVYEADLDGGNRRRKATIPGSIDIPWGPYAAVLEGEKLFFGGTLKEKESVEYGSDGLPETVERWNTQVIYCLDLNEYTFETLAVTEEREGLNEYQCDLYEYDGMIYATVSNFNGDCAIWYRIDPAGKECAEFLRFDSNVARFSGVIGDTVYYYYDNSGKTLYARDIAAGAEEREIMSVSGDDMSMSVDVVDGKILFRTDYDFEGEERMAEYAVLDRDGNLLDTIRYDDYILPGIVVGDKMIYYKMIDYGNYPDFELWWADKEDLVNLIENGVRIGPFVGTRLDTLKN